MPTLDALIKFRCQKELELRLERIANHPSNRRKLADLLRLVMEDYATEQEQRLGLGPVPVQTPVHTRYETPPANPLVMNDAPLSSGSGPALGDVAGTLRDIEHKAGKKRSRPPTSK
jgi:hypothetical protein